MKKFLETVLPWIAGVAGLVVALVAVVGAVILGILIRLAPLILVALVAWFLCGCQPKTPTLPPVRYSQTQ